MKHTVLQHFKPVRNFIFDVDGVLTNGDVLVTEVGEFLRTFNTKDGFAMRAASDKGYGIYIITGAKSEGTVKRLKAVGAKEIYYGIADKKKILNELIAKNNWNKEELLYMGDDLPDYEVMQMVGISCCPADAVDEILQIATYISPFVGGKGCVRDVIEKVLKLNNNWDYSIKVTD
jgi:3-deoxy-D-manno-octulosonate 8-phosphate phosphatase (KDO 8-P phosphatase)